MKVLRAITFAWMILQSGVSFGASPMFCNELFERGRYHDEIGTKVQRTWSRMQERFFDKFSDTILDIRDMIDLEESPELYGNVSAKIRRIRELAEDIALEGEPVIDHIGETLEILDELEFECGIHPRIEDWYYAKVDALEELEDSSYRVVDEMSELAYRLQDFESNPAKVLRRVDLLSDELDRVR